MRISSHKMNKIPPSCNDGTDKNMSTEEAKKEKRRQSAKNFRDKNPDKSRQNSKAWYERNKEDVLKRKAEYRKKKQEEEKRREELLLEKDKELERLKLLLSQQGIQV
ncbi:hypothetical protein [Brazilian marseillevirus]|uniref:hypothetical protein n=1 Tax=Brazilian marseillevirus TaxID=1813599 RepID=UPI0007855FD2|nr:hypothetical protein A3303_gp021 [Brazilian marseillevirus]AMQ10529.1 hypothetical protein [Brazilian marseillevirus]